MTARRQLPATRRERDLLSYATEMSVLLARTFNACNAVRRMELPACSGFDQEIGKLEGLAVLTGFAEFPPETGMLTEVVSWMGSFDGGGAELRGRHYRLSDVIAGHLREAVRNLHERTRPDPEPQALAIAAGEAAR